MLQKAVSYYIFIFYYLHDLYTVTDKAYLQLYYIEIQNLQSERNTESVVLPDGTVISVADYKRLQQQKKLQQQQQIARER